jgi:PAS domain S-box-containing protein
VNQYLRELLGKEPVGGFCYKEFQGLDHPCEFCTNDIILKLKGQPYQWEYHNPILNRDYEIMDRIMKWPDGREVRFEIAIDITDRKRAEDKLRESEERYRLLIENAGDAIAIVQDEYFKLVNRKMNEVLGYPNEEILAMRFWEIVHPEDREKVIESYSRRLRGEKVPEVYDFRSIDKDGNVKWAEMNAVNIFYEGKPAVLCFVRDITERKRAEEALRESEERYRKQFEGALDAIFIANAETGILSDCNRAACELVGREKSELIGRHQRDLHPPGEIGEEFSRTFKQHLEEKEGEVLEAQIITKSGEIKDVSIKANLIEVGGKKVLQGIFRDITERKRAEEALKESEKRFRELFDYAPVGYHELNREGIITRVNRTEAELLGYGIDEMIGRPIWDFIVEEENVKEIFFDKISGKIPPNPAYERRYKKKDGTLLIAIAGDRLLRDEKGEITGIRVTVQDITELKKKEQEISSLQEQLRQAQKMEAIGRLAGGIAHDFNNILSVIKGMCHLSLLDLREEDPLYSNIKEIDRSVDRAADLTRQLLAFSRKQVMEMRVMDLNEVVMGLEKMLRRIIGEDIELITYLSEGLGRVRVDPGQIEHVIINLVVNARDAMPHGGKLTIETVNVELDEEYAKRHIAVKPGAYVMLSISDTGVGMTKEVQERVFEPFFTTKEMGRGTGLGLSTVYGIVKQSGGNIWVYSEVGKGTTFKIYLPRVDEPLDERRKEVIGEIPCGSETILVVEDEMAVRKLAVRLLEKLGYKVLEASDGGQAFLLCERYSDPIHLILSDVVMPGMSGRDLVERLQKIHPEMKVLYMSGYTDNVIIHHGVLKKGIEFIQKPFTFESLARKVREVLDKR